MNNIVWIIFDSARYDTYVAARTPNLDALAGVERRWSYSSWTAPSHYTFLMGITPHQSAKGVFASTQYRKDILRWIERLGIDETENKIFSGFIPSLSLPLFLKTFGYRCEAYVSLPVLNPQTLLSSHFDQYELMPTHNCFDQIIKRMKFDAQPHFYFINTGETHYPYLLPGETMSDLPRLSGLHGVYRDLDDYLRHPIAHSASNETVRLFNTEKFRVLREKQVVCIEQLDVLFGKVLEMSPANTWFIVTSDHGELFGEDGYFGHGPIMHEKVFEVFFLEGRHP